MPAAFLWLKPFLCLAYAELKVNFVEGFAVLCLWRFKGFAVSMFLCLRRFLNNRAMARLY